MKTKRKAIVIISMLIILGISLGASFAKKPADDGELKERIEGMQKSITMLKERYVDVSSIIKKYNDIKKNLEDYEESFNENDDRRNTEMLKELLNYRVTALELDLKKKVTSIQRLDFLYIIMLVFGTVIGIGFAFYIVIMYNKRK